MSDIRDRADDWLTKVNAWHPDVRVDVEEVRARLVRCETPGCTRMDGGTTFYALVEGGGHGHMEPYETPHERIVVRLPVEPVVGS